MPRVLPDDTAILQPKLKEGGVRTAKRGILSIVLGMLTIFVEALHAQTLPTAEITLLVKKLGSPISAERERVTARLIECEEAAPALRVALRSSDREIAIRAAYILEKLGPRLVGEAFGKSTQVCRQRPGGLVVRARRFIRQRN
jgi:hypothetical protein